MVLVPSKSKACSGTFYSEAMATDLTLAGDSNRLELDGTVLPAKEVRLTTMTVESPSWFF